MPCRKLVYILPILLIARAFSDIILDIAVRQTTPLTDLGRPGGSFLGVGRLSGGGAVEDSAAFWKAADREPVSADPDIATAQVIRRMSKMARSSAAEPLFRRYAQAAIDQHKGGLGWATAGVNPFTFSPATRACAIAESAWWWAKTNLEFEHHGFLILRRIGERDQWQLLISPDVLIRQRPMKGDCAIYSTLIAAMLEAWGVPWEFVTVAADRAQPSVYSHVWVRAIMPDGVRQSLDASHGDYPGWQVPAYDIFRLQAWDSSGRPVEDRGARFQGLHNYAVRRGVGRYVRGLGVVCGTDPSSGEEWCDYSKPTPVTGAPGGGSSGTFNLFADLARRWTDIGGRAIAPQTTYTRGAGGQIQYSTPGGGGGGGMFNFTGDSGVALGSTSPLIWLALAGAAVLLVGTMAKGRG